MKRPLSTSAFVLALAVAAPARAQRLGAGGTGVDEAATLPACSKPIGTAALVEEKGKSAPRLDAMPPGVRATFEMAQAQQGGGVARGESVDPLPLQKLLAARSHCFVVVDRGAGFDALQRERAMTAGAAGADQIRETLQVASCMLLAALVYSDAKRRQSGGAGGGLSDLGVGALGGTYASSDMGRITSLAFLGGFRKRIADAQAGGLSAP